MATERSSNLRISLWGGLNAPRMRQVFYLLLAFLVLRMFFPEVATKLESAAIAFLDLANAILSSAHASAAAPGF